MILHNSSMRWSRWEKSRRLRNLKCRVAPSQGLAGKEAGIRALSFPVPSLCSHTGPSQPVRSMTLHRDGEKRNIPCHISKQRMPHSQQSRPFTMSRSAPRKRRAEKNSCNLAAGRGPPGGSADKEAACSAGDPGSIPGLRRSSGEGIGYPLQYSWASLRAQMAKSPPAMRKTWV